MMLRLLKCGAYLRPSTYQRKHGIEDHIYEVKVTSGVKTFNEISNMKDTVCYIQSFLNTVSFFI